MLYSVLRTALLGHLTAALVAPPRSIVKPRPAPLLNHNGNQGRRYSRDARPQRADRRRGRRGNSRVPVRVDTLHGDVFFKGLKFDVCAKDPKFILGPVVGALIVGKALQGGKTVAQLKTSFERQPLKKRDQATRGAAAALTLEAAAP